MTRDRKVRKARRLGLVLLALVSVGCLHARNEESYVDSGFPDCDADSVLDGSATFQVNQGAECYSLLPDGGADFRAVTLQLATVQIDCAPQGGSIFPICSGAGAGTELYLQYGTTLSPQPIPLAAGTWPVANVGTGPWLTVFLADNAGHMINAQTGQVVLRTVTPTNMAGELQALTFALPDGGSATLGGPFCTAFCGVLPDGG